MPTPFEDINWDSKYEKWGKPTHQDLIGNRPTTRPGEYDGETQDASRFDAVSEFNERYDVREFLKFNPEVAEVLPGGIAQSAGDINYIKKAMEKFHSKPTELGGMGNGGQFSSDNDYAGVARASFENFMDDFIKDPKEEVDKKIKENLPDPWWEDEEVVEEQEEQTDEAKRIVNERFSRGLKTWSGDRYDARTESEPILNGEADMHDPARDAAAQEFTNNFKRNLVNAGFAGLG